MLDNYRSECPVYTCIAAAYDFSTKVLQQPGIVIRLIADAAIDPTNQNYWTRPKRSHFSDTLLDCFVCYPIDKINLSSFFDRLMACFQGEELIYEALAGQAFNHNSPI